MTEDSAAPAAGPQGGLGPVSLTEIDGVAPEYGLAARRYLGEEAAAACHAQLDQPVTRMMRIALRPAWVAVADFQHRLPDMMGPPG
jgi:hypothetical protein